MEKTPIEMIKILPDEEFSTVKLFVELGEKLDCKNKVRFAPAHKTWKCVFSRTKPTRTLFTIECTETKWHIKACLWYIDAYSDYFNKCSEKIRNEIINAYDCKFCNKHCKGGAGFTFEGKQYQKCVGCVFYFSKLCKDDWYSLISLIAKEYEVTNNKNRNYL